MKRVLTHLLQTISFNSRPGLRNSFLVIAAFVALAVPFVLLPIGKAQRATKDLTQDQPSKTKAASSPIIYRSAGDRHKVQVSDKETGARLEAQGARLIGDYSSFLVYETDSALTNSLASDKDVQVRDEDNVVQLNSGAIDTTRSEAQALRRPGAFSGKQMLWFNSPAVRLNGIRHLSELASMR